MKRSLVFKIILAALLVPMQVFAIPGPAGDMLTKLNKFQGRSFSLAQLAQVMPGVRFINLGLLNPVLKNIRFTFERPRLEGIDTIFIPSGVSVFGISAKAELRIDLKVKPEKLAESIGKEAVEKYILKKKEKKIKAAARRGAREAFGLNGLSIIIEMPGSQFDMTKLNKKVFKMMPFKGDPSKNVYLILSNHDYNEKKLGKNIGHEGDLAVKRGVTMFGSMVTAGPIQKLIGSNTFPMEGFFPADPKGVGAYFKGRLSGDHKIAGKLRLKNVFVKFDIPSENQFMLGIETSLQTPLPLQKNPVDVVSTISIGGKPGAVIARLDGDMKGTITMPKVKGIKLDELHVEAEIDVSKLPTPAAIRAVGYKGKGSFFGKGITYGVLGGFSEKAAMVMRFDGGLYLHEMVSIMTRAIGKNINLNKMPKIGLKEARMTLATVDTKFGNETIPAGMAGVFTASVLGKSFGMTALANRSKGTVKGSAFMDAIKIGPLKIDAYEANAAGPLMSLDVSRERQELNLEGKVELALLDGIGARAKVQLASDGMIVDISPKIFPKVTNFDGRVKVVTKGGIGKKPESAEIEIWIKGADKLLLSGVHIASKGFQKTVDAAKKVADLSAKGLKEASKAMNAARGKVKKARGKVAAVRKKLNFARGVRRKAEAKWRACES